VAKGQRRNVQMKAKLHGKRRIIHAVEVDEARERLAGSREVLGLDASDGVDEIGDELGETFVENVTGADDAATEHRATDTPADEGGPFVVTSGAVEFAHGTDASNPVGAEREALPSVSAPRPRRVRT
jgi:hypothetical protein